MTRFAARSRWAAKLLAFGLMSLPGCKEATVSLLPATLLPPPAPPDDGLGPVSQWSLDADAGDTVGDNHGLPLGMVTFQTDPLRGGVLVCDGVDAAISVRNVTTLDFSYSAWIWTETPSRQGDSAISGDAIFWSNKTPALDDFTLALLNDRLSYISHDQKSTGTRSLIDGVWHHVVVTRRDAERVALYVDGQVDGDGNSGTGSLQANPSVYFCGNPEQGGYFQGKMDDVRYYERVLTPEEVLALYSETAL